MYKTIYKILFLVILFTRSIFFDNLNASYSESCYSGILIKNYTSINSNYKSKVLTIGKNYLNKLDKYSDNQKYEKLLQIVIALKKILLNEGTNNAKKDIINILVDFFECETKILNDKIISTNIQVSACIGKPTNSVYNTATSITQAWNGTTWLPSTTSTYNITSSLTECRYICTGGYTGINCDIPQTQTSDWRSKDPNCDIPDIHIPAKCIEGTTGCQIWAGCNSTLGNGIEYSVDQNCYNYIGGKTTGCNRPSNEKENLYNSKYGVNNIWGKLYTWDNSGSACAAGYHVPTDAEWDILETLLNGGIDCRYGLTTDGRLCDGLGWAGYKLKNNTNNIINALKMPLSGYLFSDGAFVARGSDVYLWSTSEFYPFWAPLTNESLSARTRMFARHTSKVGRYYSDKSFGVSVRCIKD